MTGSSDKQDPPVRTATASNTAQSKSTSNKSSIAKRSTTNQTLPPSHHPHRHPPPPFHAYSYPPPYAPSLNMFSSPHGMGYPPPPHAPPHPSSLPPHVPYHATAPVTGTAAPSRSTVDSYHTHSHKRPVPAAALSSPTPKKRPYRRTKRPKGYCDKSTITTTTEYRNSNSLNVYDAVLAESDDLLAAASEAQQLGRLKMASAYLLLLHARLVGLGKRFDKAETLPATDTAPSSLGDDHVDAHPDDQSVTVPDTPASVALPPLATTAEPMSQPTTPRSVPTTARSETSASTSRIPRPPTHPTPPHPLPSLQPALTSSTPSNPTLATPKTAAARQLASMLPNHIEMDQAMMEHLAKAAAELHAARSGRKRPDVIIAQSADVSEFLANTANQKGVANAATTIHGPLPSSSEATTTTNTGAASSGVAWSQKDVTALQTAVQDGKNPRQIASLTGRTEQQVKAYLRNQDAKARAAADLELPVADTTAPKKKGGRGRKPATTAMNTVPHASCDARSLLMGHLLETQKDNAIAQTPPSPSASTSAPAPIAPQPPMMQPFYGPFSGMYTPYGFMPSPHRPPQPKKSSSRTGSDVAPPILDKSEQ
jgi:hypothetical protein